jgi:hypothetical protein
MRLCTSHWIATYGAGAATWDDWVGTSSCPLCGGILQLYRSCNSGGLATSGEYLQLHNRLPWKPWRPLLEKTHDRCLPRRLRQLAQNVLALFSWTMVPHSLHIIVIAIPYFCVNLAPMAHRKDKALDSVPSDTAVLPNTSKFGSSAIVGTCVSPCVCSLNYPFAPLSSHAPLSTTTCSRGACDNWAVVLPGELWGTTSSVPKTCSKIISRTSVPSS